MSRDRIPLEEIARLSSFYHPVVAPDGSAIAYYFDGSGRNELYIDRLDGAGPTQLSSGEVPRNARWFIRWRDDSQAVLFHRDNDGDEQNDIWEIDRSGDAQPVVEPDGQAILFGTTDGGRNVIFSSDHRTQMNLYRYDRETDNTIQLTTFDQPVRGAVLAPMGDRLAFNANESDTLSNQDVYVADVADGEDMRRLAIGADGAEATVVDWHPTDDKLLIGDNTPDKPRVGVYDLETDDVVWYGSDEAVERPSAFLADRAGFIGTRVAEAAFEPVYFRSPDETISFEVPAGVASFPNGGHQSVQLGDGRVLFAHTTPQRRMELVAYDLTDQAFEILKEADYGNLDRDRFIDGTYVTFSSEDGTEIGGILYDSGARPSPAVVSVHGGPHGQSLRRFDQYVQFFLDRGFSVLQPNYRGSTGRGREFKHMIHHDWGGGEAADIAAAGRWLAKKEWIDEDRLVVYGGSYGGYSAYWQLVSNPGLWATGIAWIGITDLLELYDNSMPHFQATLEEQLGDPAENEELYRERSPLTHVDQMEDPILIVHGVNDPRCPIDQARRFRDALEERGWSEGEDFVYKELSEEGHGTTDLDQKVRAFRIIESYLEEWV